MIKKVGLVSRCDKPNAIAIAKDIIVYLKNRTDVFVDPCTARKLNMKETQVSRMREKGVEIVITVGGDGTVLRTIQHMNDPLPVLAINMGTLGFLVDVDVEDAKQTIDSILSGFTVEERFRLDVRINNHLLPPATNEVVIITSQPAKMLGYRILVDDHELEQLRADGLIIATPTGSTAYAMSAGGPIVDPRVDAMVVVPLAPFKLSSRPWTVPGQSVITVELMLPDKEGQVVIDGQYFRNIAASDTIVIEKASVPARFVHIRDDNIYDKVKKKLHQ
ncbi:MAG: NAD(+)/NADH kinase [Methanosarcinales archaeon]|nr:NAD(+)/NADH kinase [Methanosarcinales archaeon]